MKKRIGLLALLGLSAGCGPDDGGPAARAQEVEPARERVPAIDRELPGELRTATFAVG